MRLEDRGNAKISFLFSLSFELLLTQSFYFYRYDPLSIENTGIALVVASGVNTIFVFIYIHQQLSYRPSEQPSEPAEKEEAAGS